MDSIVNTFHIDIKIIIAQAINFAIVFSVLYFFAVKPLKKLMAERSEKIEGGLLDAKRNAEILKRGKEDYEEILKRAHIEANTIFQNAKFEAETNKEKIIAQTEKEVEMMVENGKKMLNAEKVKMVEEAKKEVVDLVVRATEKLIESQADADYEEKALKNIRKI